MSHGCSGDIWRRDYKQPAPRASDSITIDGYTKGLLDIAAEAYKSISYRDDAGLAMAESRLELKYRIPDRQRLQWAERVVAQAVKQPPKTPEEVRAEVYAREQIILHQRQTAEIVVQALRIGDIAIATTPNETYALTGLKLKLQSPLPKTMVIELANGGDGYIPPPEQHFLGGYNTWPARSAGLEIAAEPKIAAAALDLLEQVAGKPRRVPTLGRGPGFKALAELEPVAHWRLDEMAGPRAVDSSGNNRDAFYEPGVAFFLAGAGAEAFEKPAAKNRAAPLCGRTLKCPHRRLERSLLGVAVALERHARRCPRGDRLDALARSRPPTRPAWRSSRYWGYVGRSGEVGVFAWRRRENENRRSC